MFFAEQLALFKKKNKLQSSWSEVLKYSDAEFQALAIGVQYKVLLSRQ